MNENKEWEKFELEELYIRSRQMHQHGDMEKWVIHNFCWMRKLCGWMGNDVGTWTEWDAQRGTQLRIVEYDLGTELLHQPYPGAKLLWSMDIVKHRKGIRISLFNWPHWWSQTQQVPWRIKENWGPIGVERVYSLFTESWTGSSD
mgnify:CR=1 FL=1